MSRKVNVPTFLLAILCLAIGACATHTADPQPTLEAPNGTSPEVAAVLHEGNERFAQGRWGAAQIYYERVIQLAPDLAEAHYNLALVLERVGRHEEARAHYIEAANLAPGHTVIWNSPPLRRFGNVSVKSSEPTAAPVLPALGGLGGGYGQ
ncbi:MAG: tetratricopeptide repeat protein [Nitrospirae bacterium]|nr:MAG: tetratricopeptide repeat protein [Nitrospirota bacterium]